MEMRILIVALFGLCANFLADGLLCSLPRVFTSMLGLDDGYNLRDWIDRHYSRGVRNILSPIAQRDGALRRLMIKLEIDGQWFWLIFDTGSDLTWVPMDNATVQTSHNGSRFANYYRPVDGQPLGAFRKEYGLFGRSATVQGRRYLGPVKFSNTQCRVNLTYGVATWIRWFHEDFAGIFGAALSQIDEFTGEEMPTILSDPMAQELFPDLIFTVVLKPWTGDEQFRPLHPNQGSIMIGNTGERFCSSNISYGPPIPADDERSYWEFPIGKLYFGFTLHASQQPNASEYIKEIPLNFELQSAYVDTGSPVIGIPDFSFGKMRMGNLEGTTAPTFKCGDPEVRIEMRVQMRDPPHTVVIMDNRHLIMPVRDGKCNFKIIPHNEQTNLGLPFYNAAGCVIHDYIAKRVGIAPLRRRPAMEMWESDKDPDSFDIYY